MAEIVATSSTSSNTSQTINLPVTAAIVAVDLLLVLLATDGGVTLTWPAGWVEIKDAPTASSTAAISVAYKIAAGGETTVVATLSSAERHSSLAVKIAAANWHGTTPPEISSGATGTSASPNPDALTPSWGSGDTLFMAIAAWDNSAGGNPVTAWPTNYTDNQTQANDISSAGRLAIATRVLTGTTDDPAVFTITSDEWWAGTLAIRSAGAGALPKSIMLNQAIDRASYH